MGPVTDVNDQRLVIGTDETRRQAREELKLHVAVQRAMRSGLPELPRGDLEFQRFDIVEHRQTGALYHVQLGQLDDPDRSGAVAFFIAEDGLPRYLEQPPGPRTRAEAEAQRQALEQRKAERAAVAASRPWARQR
jgi:hypothetical protein